MIQVFERCLPSVISGRDFGRLVTLANIGLHAAGVKPFHEKKEIPILFTWNKQLTFISQCRSLFTKAYYWKILQYFNVPFDPQQFEEIQEGNDKKNMPRNESKRSLCVILQCLIGQASSFLQQWDLVTDLALDFSKNFSITSTFAIQTQIEVALKWPKNGGLKGCSFGYEQVAITRNLIKTLLTFLPTREDRCIVLRRCVIDLERIEESGKDFEHYSLLLSLYHNELCNMIKESKTESAFYREDIQKIVRRLDALAILSSFFEGKPYDDRPMFQRCFNPLTAAVEDINFCGVLGLRDTGAGTTELFDPLTPLGHCLKDEKAVSALAPLCSPLGLPNGFIHARSLIERFESARNLKTPYPSLKHCIVPIIKRLKNPKDGTQLAEWCANQYPDDFKSRLTCLTMAYNLAIRSSSEAETLRRKYTDDTDNQFTRQEREALDVLKRITDTKALMEDEIVVTDCLEKDLGATEGLDKLLSQVLEKVRCGQMEDPKQVVENLLVQGSLFASKALLNRKIGITENDFNKLSRSIHHACQSLEEKYSHIDVHLISKNLVQQLLMHGDENLKSSMNITSINKIGFSNNDSFCGDDDDTGELLVLNMKNMNVIAASQSSTSTDMKHFDKQGFTSNEEQSSLNEPENGREMSEYLSARVGLRVAFILSGSTKEQDMEKHAKHLLKIIFAKSGGRTGLKKISPNTFNTEVEKSIDAGVVTKGLTFAMRYRALRAVSAMCHREVIQSIVEEEKFVDRHNCTFSQICFGSLVAKEIEAMRLSLPHSDLEQISIMHHPSFARTLHKHFYHSNCNGYKGRFLLLSLELILRGNEKEVDIDMLKTILLQILNNNLPRTILLACESLAATNILEHVLKSDKEVGPLILELSKKLTSSILKEVNKSKESVDAEKIIATVYRLSKAVQKFLEHGVISNDIILFVKLLCKIGDTQKNDDFASAIYDSAVSISRKLSKDTMNEAFSIILSNKSGYAAFHKIVGDVNTCDQKETSDSSEYSDCLHKILELEKQSIVDVAALLINFGNAQKGTVLDR